MTESEAAIHALLDQLALADEEARQSSLAWVLGPDPFLRHIAARAEAARKRIDDEHDEPAPAAAPGPPTV